MRYVISASPLVKVYLVEFHDRLLEQPDLIFDHKEEFSFSVPHGCGAFPVKFNKPCAVNGRDDKVIEVLYGWLTGEAGHSYHETDIYGLVPFDPGVDLVERQHEMEHMEGLLSDDPKVVAKAQKEVAKMQLDTAKRMKEIKERVVMQSEARIKRAMKGSHNNLIRQWQLNEENKMGKYPPSIAEMLGAHALDKDIKAAAAKGAPLKKRMNDLMGNINT